ncbi:MAG: B12-binding domain-containing radical SAM protein [Thermoanaerobaculia bacterium]|nr:B12-binding domain-containing radical SAM protein [Thermoanaerobaculia bacterium]
MGRTRHHSKAHHWKAWRDDERPTAVLPPHRGHRLALGYANSYHVGMSSLGFQRTHELVFSREDWSSERFFLDGEGMPLTVESDTPITEFGCVAFSVSFEQDYVNLLQLLDRAGIPLRRSERHEWDPLIVLGGSCAAINPLPMADFIDIFPLGAAENVLPTLLAALEEETGREAVLERLAATPGFYIPAHHEPEALHDPGTKLRKLELTAEQMRAPGHLPTTVLVTPRTEFRDKFLIEMSRGCPEKCRYCWASFGMGKFRWHPTDYILAAMERARSVTDQLGFVATAVGDHPEIERILETAVDLGFRGAVSSIRIPAVTEGVLRSLHASGDRSITLAPETGTDSLRQKMGKFVTNEMLLEKIRMIFDSGFTQLKLYFLVGLPDETDEDVQGILDLSAQVHEIMREAARRTGVMGHLHLGANILIPKPYTPWQRHAMGDERDLKRKIRHLRKGVDRLPNASLGPLSIRQAVWQTYISKGGVDVGVAIEKAARGASLGDLLREFADQIRPEVFTEMEGELRWHFMRTG